MVPVLIINVYLPGECSITMSLFSLHLYREDTCLTRRLNGNMDTQQVCLDNPKSGCKILISFYVGRSLKVCYQINKIFHYFNPLKGMYKKAPIFLITIVKLIMPVGQGNVSLCRTYPDTLQSVVQYACYDDTILSPSYRYMLIFLWLDSHISQNKSEQASCADSINVNQCNCVSLVTSLM